MYKNHKSKQFLRTFTPSDVDDLDLLMHELSPTSFCNEAILESILDDENSHAYVIRENSHIIAAGTLCVIHTLEFTNACIESVVVSSKQRGRGLGKQLVGYMIDEAKRMNINSLHLTSNPKRVQANNLYQRMGFVRYETNCYVFNVK